MDRALSLIREAIARALATYLNAFSLPDLGDERAALLDELLALAEAERAVELLLHAHERRLIDALERGDLLGVDAAIAAYGHLAESLRQPLYLSTHRFWRAMRARLAGQFDDAERLSREALALAQRAARPDAFILFGGQMIDLRRAQGRLDEVEPMLRGLAEQFPAFVAFRYVLAFVHAELGRTDEARRELETLAARDFADVPHNPVRPFLLGLLARTYVTVRDTARAALLYDLLRPYAAQAAITFQGMSYQGAVAYSLALLAALLGREQRATAHFEAALTFNARMGARPYIAQTQTDYAAFLLDRAAGSGRQAPDEERARALLAEALATARELGMRAVAQRAEALIGALPSLGGERRPGASRLPGGLTEREIDVLRLIAAGKTYREIAAALVLSPQTVHRHTSNIYRKLDISTRAEAAAYAVRHGLSGG